MKFYFSETTKGFYPEAIMGEYKLAGTLPDDIVEVSTDEYEAYTTAYPVGKVLGSINGHPVWLDAPLPTHDELVDQANIEKASRLIEVNTFTQPWQTQLMLGLITDRDKALLTEWMKYYQAVQGVDASKAPDITWPEKPAM